MRPIDPAVLKMLDLRRAIREEGATVRGLLPEEPGWRAVEAEAEQVAAYIANQVRKGIALSPEVESIARKAGRGVRPLAYWGVAERILYRALANAALENQPGLDRSIDAYLEFVKAPLVYARGLQNEDRSAAASAMFLFFGTSKFKYVVTSDLTAFYQFVDHELLADELIAQGADYGVVESLIEVLGEIQGRSRGLPQLLDSSDGLSEVYVDRVERRLLARGFAAWRYNDDFRIATETFGDALSAIEALDSAARSVGLAVSESKTRTYTMFTYAMQVSGWSESKVGAAINPDEVEDVAGDYQDDFTGDQDSALALIQSARTENVDDDGIDLKSVKPDQIRIIRRAFAALIKPVNPGALERVQELLIYVPYLTPTLMRYLQAVADHKDSRDQVAQVVDRVLEGVSMNNWQQQWIMDLIRQTGLIDAAQSNDSRLAWVRERVGRETAEPLRSGAFRTLAITGRISAEDLIAEADAAPEAVKATYLTAVVECLHAYPDMIHESVLKSLAGKDVLHRVLLTTP